MSIFQFSEFKYVKTFEANEEVRLGNFKPPRVGQLGNIRVNLVIVNFANLGGSETLTMKIYSNPEITDLLYTSNTVSISDIDFSGATGSETSFIGFVRFDFDDEHLNLTQKYYPTVTIANYTPSASVDVGLAYDYPDPVYDNGETDFFNHPIAFQIFDKTQRQV